MDNKMIDKEMKKLLSEIDAPQPSSDATNNAQILAMAAFDEKMKKNEKKTQGNANSQRHKVANQNYLLTFGRNIMKKKYALSGMSGAVAACALLVLVGVPVAYQLNLDDSKSTQISSSSLEIEGSDVQSKHFRDVTANMTSTTSSMPFSGVLDSISNIGREDSKENRQKESQVLAAKKPASKNEAVSYELKKQKTYAGTKRDRVISNKAIYSREADSPAFAGKTQDKAIVSGRRKVFAEAEMVMDRSSAVAPQAQGTMMAIAPRPSPAEKMRIGVSIGEQEAYPGVAVNLPYPADPDDVIINQHQVVGDDEFTDFKDNSIKLVKEEPVSTLSVDVDTASYSFMRRQLNNGVLPQKDAIRVEELINYFNYGYDVPESKTIPFKPSVAVYDSPWHAGNKLVHIGIKGHDLAPAEKPRSNLVFLLDVSGSMNAADKLPLLKNAFSMLVNNLNPDDTVAIVVYAGAAGMVLEPTKVSNKHKILSALNRLRAGGSTAGAAGIRQAYALAESNFDKEGVNRVILATDGDFNVGIRNHQELQDFVERKRETGIFLSVLGFGQGNYHDNLMQTLAQNGNGNAAYIDTLSEARKVLVDEGTSTLFTIAKDVKIQIEFNPKTVSEYRLIGYETRHLERQDFNNDAIDAAEIGAGHTVTAIYEITPVNAESHMVDPLRYLAENNKITALKAEDESNATSNEYAFLKMRYKLPNESKSKLISQAITTDDDVTFDKLSNDMRFASAVAAFGQKLRGGSYLNGMSYDEIIKIAQNARGYDAYGYRTEFINLVRLAKSHSAR